MRPFHLHSRSRHDPDCLSKINFVPAREAQFAGPDEQKGRELKRETSGRLSAVAFDGPQ
jgi:hypothetical protein